MASKLVVKKKPKVKEDKENKCQDPRFPWFSGYLPGKHGFVSKMGKKKKKKDNEKDDKGKGAKDDVVSDDANPYLTDHAESHGCPRTLLGAVKEREDYKGWNKYFGEPADSFDLFFQEYPKAVQNQLLNEYARSATEWKDSWQEEEVVLWSTGSTNMPVFITIHQPRLKKESAALWNFRVVDKIHLHVFMK